MKSIKQIIALLLLCLFAFFVACDSKKDDDYDEDEEEIEEDEEEEEKEETKKKPSSTKKPSKTEKLSETEDEESEKSEDEESEESEPSEDSEPMEESEPFEETEEELGEETEKSELIKYNIICSSGASKKVQNIAKKIRDSINQAHGISLRAKNDNLKDYESVDTIPDYEIVVGDTNRPDSEEGYKSAGTGGWWVKTYGNRIVINAITIDGMELAANYFIKNYEYDEETGLVSIGSDKVFKTENDLYGKELRVGTYNIKNGEIAGHDMTEMGALIKELDLDIIGLQEVDICTSRAQRKNILKLLAEAAGYEYYEFAKALDMNGGGEYGTAVMSRYPITSFETKKLDVATGTEQRVMGCAKIDVNGCEITFVSTHFSLDGESVRARQFEQVLEYAKQSDGYIVVGDFNVGKLSEFTVLPDVVLTNSGTFLTFPAVGGSDAIDEIILDCEWSVIKNGMDSINALSDHSLLWAEIKYCGGK